MQKLSDYDLEVLREKMRHTLNLPSTEVRLERDPDSPAVVPFEHLQQAVEELRDLRRFVVADSRP